MEAQSRSTCHPTITVILKLDTPLTEEREKMETAMDPTMESTRSPTMDEIPPTFHHQGGPNKHEEG